MPTELVLRFGEEVSRFILAVATGQAREIACFGTRGDGKTWGAFGAMLTHAQKHQAAGFPLPVDWLGVGDTFASHKAKTHRSLAAAGWGGIWSLEDDGHLARCRVSGADLVRLRLVGVEDQQGLDRLRTETVGVWFEEPAPASVMVQSSGLTEDAWALAMTSQRLPSHAHVAMLTSNYPDEDHWTWQRFVQREHAGTAYFRVPPGERASPEQREEWTRALAGRPDLLRRLIAGQPGVLAQGPEVAVGYREELHVAKQRLMPVKTEPLTLGHDGGHTPTTVIGQRWDGRVRIYAGLVTQGAGMRQHLAQTVLPWLGEHAPWALEERAAMRHRYDPSLDTGDQGDIDMSPVVRIRQELGGGMLPGSVTWPGRIDPVLALLGQLVQGEAVLQISPGPDTDLLRKALRTRWHYAQNAAGALRKDLPHKPNHPWEDLGDALCYLVGGLAPSRPMEYRNRKPTVRVAFNPLDWHRQPARRR